MSTKFSKHLFDFIDQRRKKISAEEELQIKLFFCDWIGCLLCGLQSEIYKKILDCLSSGLSQPISLFKRPKIDQAFLMGAASHCLELDDSEFFGETHPSAVIFSALIAIAEDDLPIEKILPYAACGYYSLLPIGNAMNPQHYQMGWHGTGTVGTLASTVACSFLKTYSYPDFENSLRAASTLMGGTHLSFGSPLKYFNSGRAAQNGLLATSLSETFSRSHSSNDIFSGEKGIFTLFGGAHQSDFRVHQTPDLSFIKLKTDPFCHCLQPIVDLSRDLLRSKRFDFSQIDFLKIKASKYFCSLINNSLPNTPAESYFSLPYAVFCSRFTRIINFHRLKKSAFAVDVLSELSSKIKLEVDECLTFMDFSVELKMKNGVLSNYRQSFNRGFTGAGIDSKAYLKKFRQLMKASTSDKILTERLIRFSSDTSSLLTVGELKACISHNLKDLPNYSKQNS